MTKVIMQWNLIAVAYTLRTYWKQFSLGGICKQKLDCTNIQPLYYFTITGMWLFLEIGLYLWFQDGFKLFIHFFLVDPLSTGPKIIVLRIFIHYYMDFLSNNPKNPFCVVFLGSPFRLKIKKKLKFLELII